MKFTKFCLLLLCAAVAIIPSFAQKTDASIVGHVVDKYTGKHLPYITISIEGTTIGCVTDGTGHYSLNNLPIGELTVVASAVGYGKEEMVVTTAKDKTQECKFSLAEQTIDVDQVVVSATKNVTNRKVSAAIVNVASVKQFENTASATLSETMSFQPGLRVENTCGNCGAMQLRINGLEGQYSQILLDSRPLFSSLAGVYGIEQLPVAMIERVEVIRGGGSALFGSSAIGGVVNIITKEPLRSSLTISNTTNVLKGGTTDVTTSINGSFVTDDHKAGVYIFGMLRDKGAYDRNGDGFTETPMLKTETIGFRGYYKTSNYSKLTAEYHHITDYRRGGNDLDLQPHETAITEQVEYEINGGSLNFDYFSPNYKHKFNINTSYQAIIRDSYYGADYDEAAYGDTTDDTFVVGGQYTYSYTGFIAPANLTFGTEYTSNALHDLMPGYDRDLQQNTKIAGAYVQNEWNSDKVNVVVGGRLDKHNLIDNVIFSPRVSARYSPSESVGLRASYSSGYRAPQAFNEDLHIEAVAGGVSLIVLDPDLKPEYSNSFNVSADLYKTFGNVQTNLLVEGFYTKLDDVFILEQTDEYDNSGNNTIWERTNGSGAVVKGVSADVKVGMVNKFEVQAGYTFQKSQYLEAEVWSDDVEGTRTMFRSPDHYGYISANYDVTDKFKASVFGNYTGKMLVQHAAGCVEVDENVWTPNFWDFGFKLAYNFKISDLFNLELHAGMKNILDHYQSDLETGELKDAGYVYGPSLPRTVFFGAKIAF